MSDIKQFTTAAKRASKKEDEQDVLEFEVDGRTLRAYPPDSGQLAMLLASVGRGSTEMERVAGTINFFVKIMDDASASFIESRLLDRNDPFDIDDVEEIIEWMTEEWSGRPTQSPSGSTQSQPNGGADSTRPSLLSS